jgi:protein-S-isoprenylcysteine O-methyltransferase Ste14
MPALLPSWWAIIACGLCVTLLLFRTDLEDRPLQVKLAGIADFAGQVCYRLLPGTW